MWLCTSQVKRNNLAHKDISINKKIRKQGILEVVEVVTKKTLNICNYGQKGDILGKIIRKCSEYERGRGVGCLHGLCRGTSLFWIRAMTVDSGHVQLPLIPPSPQIPSDSA